MRLKTGKLLEESRRIRSNDSMVVGKVGYKDIVSGYLGDETSRKTRQVKLYVNGEA